MSVGLTFWAVWNSHRLFGSREKAETRLANLKKGNHYLLTTTETPCYDWGCLQSLPPDSEYSRAEPVERFDMKTMESRTVSFLMAYIKRLRPISGPATFSDISCFQKSTQSISTNIRDAIQHYKAALTNIEHLQHKIHHKNAFLNNHTIQHYTDNDHVSTPASA